MSVNGETDLFLPSLWSKRLTPNVIVNEHLKKCRAHSEENPKLIKTQLNSRYGPEPESVYDIFGLDLGNGAPIFIYIHGGYWQRPEVTRDLYWFIAKNMHKNGIKSMFIEYECCPKIPLPEISKNIEVALGECLKYAEDCGTSDIHISGHSAGAHLVIELFDKFIPNLPIDIRNKFKTAFLISGIYDLVPIIQTSLNEPLKLDETTAAAASPLRKKINAGSTKIYIIIPENDCPALIEQAQALEKHLIRSEVNTQYVYLENLDHFDIVENLFNENFVLTKFIIKAINQSL